MLFQSRSADECQSQPKHLNLSHIFVDPILWGNVYFIHERTCKFYSGLPNFFSLAVCQTCKNIPKFDSCIGRNECRPPSASLPKYRFSKSNYSFFSIGFGGLKYRLFQFFLNTNQQEIQ